MSVVPPIAAAGVILPVGVGLASGEPPTPMLVAGILVAIVGVVLASVGTGSNDDPDVAVRIAPKTLGLCLVAATGFGLIFVAMDAAAGDTATTALAATAGVRLGSFLSVLCATLATRTDPRSGVNPRTALSFGGIGMFDTGANLTFAIAAALGELEVVALLGTLYPAVTSALAHVVLGEKLGRVQFFGVALVLVGIAILVTR
jgi:drug/metabolite transporter (DMT)-like permease